MLPPYCPQVPPSGSGGRREAALCSQLGTAEVLRTVFPLTLTGWVDLSELHSLTVPLSNRDYQAQLWGDWADE